MAAALVEKKEEEDIETIVIVIGFYGSTKRHVEKYGKVWREDVDQNINQVLLFPCSGTLSMFTLGAINDAKAIVRKVQEIVQKQPSRKYQVIFHVLSNRGMWVYLETVRRLARKIKVAGVVFDSCKLYFI
jgi:hypothetical protein